MPFSTRTDPLRNFKFRITINLPEISGLPSLGFASMSGLSVQNEMIPYREGGWNTSPHKMVGQTDFAPVSFSRGVMPLESQLWEWQKYMHFVQWGQGNLANPDAYRCDITVDIYDHPVTQGVSLNAPGRARLRYNLYNCWPSALAMNELDATANALLIQQMTIHHEGFEPVWL